MGFDPGSGRTLALPSRKSDEATGACTGQSGGETGVVTRG